MDNRHKVSVIIVNYNGIAHIDACVSSVLRQTHDDFEVILVDNNSTDDSLSYAQAKFPNLIFVSNKENLGYGGGICSGLGYASGEYVAPLNVDTEVTCDWLSNMVYFLDENLRAGAVTPKILLFDDRNIINALGVDIHISGLGFCRELYKRDCALTEERRVCGVSGCSYLIRREILERINEVVSEWDRFYDDMIVSWLTNLMGYDIYCIPKAVVYHKYTLKMNPEKFSVLEVERYRLLLSTLKPLTFLFYFPVFAAIEFLTASYALLKGRQYIRSKARAICSVLRQLPDIVEKRQRYLKLRKISDFELFKKLRWNLECRQLLGILK